MISYLHLSQHPAVITITLALGRITHGSTHAIIGVSMTLVSQPQALFACDPFSAVPKTLSILSCVLVGFHVRFNTRLGDMGFGHINRLESSISTRQC